MPKNDVPRNNARKGPTNANVPAPPESFVPLPRWERVGWRPLKTAVARVPEALGELATFPGWDATFGVAAPAAAVLAERLQTAADWSVVLQQTRAWLAYVESQEGATWRLALETLATLKAPFRLAAAANPAVRERLPALAELVGAQETVARRSAATRKRQRRSEEASEQPEAGEEASALSAPPPSRGAPSRTTRASE